MTEPSRAIPEYFCQYRDGKKNKVLLGMPMIEGSGRRTKMRKIVFFASIIQEVVTWYRNRFMGKGINDEILEKCFPREEFR